MGGPALMAALARDWEAGRAFLYAGIFSLVWAGVLGLALARRDARMTARTELTGLVAVWLVLPAFAAIPLAMATPAIGTYGAWFEMVAAFTTTGGTAYDRLADVPQSIHLWRGMMGWLGGFVTLMAAFVIMAPRRIGGFEVEAAMLAQETATNERLAALGAGIAPLSERIARARRVILPIYVAMTVGLMALLSLVGQDPMTAAMHAMAVISTSGISHLPNGLADAPSFLAELAIALFLLAALTRIVYAEASQIGARMRLRQDPELRLAAIIVALSVTGLFLRHWIGAMTITLAKPAEDVLAALWGSFFTVLSFLSTTGFESAFWDSARGWSGWANPGLILLGLCAIGGGAATTAGGVKLIRAWTLARQGMRELERMAQPSSIRGVGPRARGMMREGAVLVWAFIMLFILALLATVYALTIAGMKFEEALAAAIAALSNCGPAFPAVAESARGFGALTDVERTILAVAMVLGRIETLALIALVNPDSWSRSGRNWTESSGKTRREGTD